MLFRLRPASHRLGSPWVHPRSRLNGTRTLRIQPLEDRHLLSVGVLGNERWWDLSSGTVASADPSASDSAASETQLLESSSAGADVALEVSGAWIQEVTLEGKSFARLELSDGGLAGEVGQPEQPVLRTLLVAPDDAVVTADLAGSWQTVSLADLGINVPLAPVQSPVAKLPEAEQAATLDLDPAAYQLDQFLGQGEVRIAEAGRFAGRRLVSVEVTPLCYNPVQKSLAVCQNATLSVQFSGGKAAEAPLSAAEEVELSRLVENYTAQSASSTSGRLLIIAHDSLVAEPVLATSFVQHKEGRGWTVDLVGTSTAGTTTTAIQAYIQGRYADLATRPDAVLLVGDTGLVPQWVATWSDDQPDTDLYYACTDSAGTDDWLPELAIGRFSVTDATQLDSVISKTIAYETSSAADWQHDAVFMASTDNYSITEGTHDYVISTYMDAFGYTSDKLYSNDGATTAQVSAAFNAGRIIGCYSGHGSETSWADGPAFSQANVNALTNAGMYPFVTSFSCLTGKYSVSECFAETWQRAAGKGSVDMMASSVYSYWTEDDMLEKKLFSAIYDEGVLPFGSAILRAKELYLQAMGSGTTTRRYFEMYNLFGDPTVELVGLDLGIGTRSSLPQAYVGESYNCTLSAYGGTGPYTWSIVAGSLPENLTLDPASGLISGTPAAVTSVSITVQVTDATLATAQKTLELNVATRLVVTTPSPLPLAALTVPYSVALQAVGGSNPYTWSVTTVGEYTETDPGSTWLGGGTAQSWQDDDASWSLTLPWTFSFYGTGYTSVNVCSNGYLDFTSASAEYDNTSSGLLGSVRVAPLWDDLVTTGTGDDIFVTQTSDYVAVRWQAHTYSGSYAVNVEAVLYCDGRIRFNYGAAHSGLTPTIGISSGDGSNFLLSSRNGATSIAANVSSEFTYQAPLPPGLSLASNGVLSGTPTQTGTYSFTVETEDSAPVGTRQSVTTTYSLTVGLPAAISVSLPAKAWESQGTLASAGMITLSSPAVADLLVTLVSSDASELTMPSSVTVLAGQTSAPFNVTVVDDDLFDGAQGVTVSASAPSSDTVQASINIGDNEVHHLAFGGAPGSSTAGVAFPITVTAQDINGETVEVYNGTVPITASAGGSPVPITLGNKAASSESVDTPVPAKTDATMPLGVYQTYEEITAGLHAYAADHADICTLVSIGLSVEGRDLWAIKITDNPSLEEDEPEAAYLSTIHGDEKVGTEMCLYFIDYLLNGYGTDAAITSLVDDTELWILPLVNPDGWAASTPTRENANGVDMNRNFPEGGSPYSIGNVFDGPAVDTTGCEPEVVEMIDWSVARSLTLAANFHAGAMVVNYPYDNDGRSSGTDSPSPDDALFESLAVTYSSHNLPMYNSTEFSQGITNGAAWYVVTGGLQDWSYRYLGCDHVTIELNDTKTPDASELPTLWNDNRDAMMAYFQAVHIGVRGVVSDAVTGLPVYAKISIFGNTQPAFTDPDAGDYHRLLLPGTYSIVVSAPGYNPQTISSVAVVAGSETRLDVSLSPLSSGVAFVGGIWTGSVAIDAVAAGVVLSADDGQGHVGQSSAFSVVSGPLDHFTWSTIAGPQTAGCAFSVTVTAQDVRNYTVDSFSGTATLSAADDTGSVAITPLSTTAFVGGVWTGLVTVGQATAGVRITASADAYSGSSNRFVVVVANDLDADGNGAADALTDGILILRYLFDPAGAWNYSDALGSGATRTNRTDIRTYLDGAQPTVLDVDGNGTADALTDGILILRYLFDPAGAWNYSDALGTGAIRTNRAAIKAFLDQYNPVLAAGVEPASSGLVEEPVARLEASSSKDDSDPASVPTLAVSSSTTLDLAEPATVLDSPVVVAGVSNAPSMAGVATAVLLSGDGEDDRFARTAAGGQSTEPANPHAQDTVLARWRPCDGNDIPTAGLVAWLNSNAPTDDLDGLFGNRGVSWFHRKPDDSVDEREADEFWL